MYLTRPGQIDESGFETSITDPDAQVKDQVRKMCANPAPIPLQETLATRSNLTQKCKPALARNLDVIHNGETKTENKTMKIERRRFTGFAVAALMIMATISFAFDKADKAAHVRWDIISLVFSTTPFTVNSGGVAFAKTDDGSTIKLTGSGTFVAPAGRHGRSGAATGEGTWETFGPTGTPTGSGNYVVVGLVRFELANFGTPVFIDNVGDINEAANGTANVEVEFDDGSRGILGIGCHGPGAPPGIDEGVITTKGFVTYWNAQNPAPGVDANRTAFHVRQK